MIPKPIAFSPLVAVAMLAAFSPPPAALANVKLPSVFTDHLVLQRDLPAPVWGWADPGEKVTVEFAGQTKTATADANGKWELKLDALGASEESRTLTVRGNNTIALSDVLVGEVWICSGQSNMSFAVHDALDADKEIAAANYPHIRLFTASYSPQFQPQVDVKGQWSICSSQTAPGFSAVAYFFGRELNRELKIPVGLIHTSVGGTPVEAWTSQEALDTVPEAKAAAEKEIAAVLSQPEDSKRFVADRAAWQAKYNVAPPKNAGVEQGWESPNFDASGWQKATLPATWEHLGFKTGGAFWIRRDFDIPESDAGKPFHFSMNTIIADYDTAYFNGHEIGSTGDIPPHFNEARHDFNVPANIVKAGRNVLALRIVSANPKLAIGQWPYHLAIPAADPHAPTNEWLVKQESAFPALTNEALKEQPKPSNAEIRTMSTGLFNGMIAPLIPYAIRGAIWYQGENNAGRGEQYRTLLPLMIRDWRSRWGEGDFAFDIVQLVNYQPPPKTANEASGWALLREAEDLTARTTANCGMSVGIDIGEDDNIHPKDKQDVGKRLAAVALVKTYNRPGEFLSPEFASFAVEGDAIRVKFSHIGGGLVAKGGGPLQRFAIAGDDSKFVWADAKIDGDSVLVSSPEVPQPVAVRYAWANNPTGANLYNKEGLPAAPFRTDGPIPAAK
jgi:sialate O-acetylesterase